MNEESAVNIVEETIVREEFNKPGQEQFMSDLKGSLRAKTNEIDITKVIPVSNNIIIKCKKRNKIGAIYLPNKVLDREFETIEIISVSKRVQDNQPDITPGKLCYVNMYIVKQVGGLPIHSEKDGEAEYEYYSVSAETVVYLYEFR